VSPQPTQGRGPLRGLGAVTPPSHSSPGMLLRRHHCTQFSTPGPPCGPPKLGHCEQSQLLTKEESLSPTNKKPIYLFLISAPGCWVLLRERCEPLCHPRCQPGLCHEIFSSRSSSSSASDEEHFQGWAVAQGRLGAAGFLHFHSLGFSVRWLFPPELRSCPSLLLRAPRYCFKSHERSFVVEQFHPPTPY